MIKKIASSAKTVSVLATMLLALNSVLPVFAVSPDGDTPPPVVSLSASPTSIMEWQSVSFTGSFTDGSDPEGVKWYASMNYGEGNSEIIGEKLPGSKFGMSHQYKKDGIFQAELCITRKKTSYGGVEEATGCTSVSVTVMNNPPEVTVSPSSKTVEKGTSVKVTASVKNGNSPISYKWSNACSGTGTSANAPSTVGTHKCTVTVTDADGDKDSATATITVVNKPNPDPDPDPEPTPDPTPEPGDGGSDEEAPEEPVEEVLGEQTCDEKQKISGYVFYDADEDGDMDSDENGAGNVVIEVYSVDEGSENEDDGREIIARITTSKAGYWSTSVCSGKYTIEIDEDSLTDEMKLTSDAQLDLEVKDKSVKDINFALEALKEKAEEEDGGIDWWVILAALLLVFGGAGTVMLFAAKRKKDEDEQEGQEQMVE